jgi:hypothetical protein
MATSDDRLLLIRAAVTKAQRAQAPIAPTQAQIDAGFAVAKAAINAMVSQLVPPWAAGMVNITDDEIHAVSDAVAQAVVNS